MSYKLGKRSLERLEGVDERMVAVVKFAIHVSKQDFSVLEGLRTIERQRELKDRGASRTMKSKHIPGLAVDLGAYDSVTGIRWEEALYFEIAEAMREGAKSVGVGVCWGGGWAASADKEYPYDFRYWTNDMKSLNKTYHKLRDDQGRNGFNDMPHFELID